MSPNSACPCTVGHEQEALFFEGLLLELDDLADPFLSAILEETEEVLPRERAFLGPGLDLDELAAVGLDDVPCRGRPGYPRNNRDPGASALDDADADAGDEVAQGASGR